MSSDLKQRLAAHRLDVTPEHTERAMSAIRAELQLPPRTGPYRQTGSLRRLALAAATASILLLPAMAIASDDAVPGDLLFPVKTTVERFWQVVDPDVIGRHRVEEVERLIQMDAPPETIAERVRLAEEAVATSDPALLERLEHVRRTTQTRTEQSPHSGGGDGAGPTEPQGTFDQPYTAPNTEDPPSPGQQGDPPDGTNRQQEREPGPPTSVSESGPTETDAGTQGVPKRQSTQNRDHGG